MAIKLLIFSAAILIIIMSLFAIFKTNLEENKGNFNSDTQKFIGKWRLINTGANEGENEIPDTTEESDNFGYETYEFLPGGNYYHVLNEDNTSGVWEINNSDLILTVKDPFGVLPLSYEYIFSDDNHRVTLNLVEEPEYFLELEKISAV